MIVTVSEHGWQAVRNAIFDRDGGCVAVAWKVFGKATAPDGCRDSYGDPCDPGDFAVMEAEHVKEAIGGFKPPDDSAHLVTVCPWHHRLSQRFRVDSKANREQTRAWLAKHYPEVWG